MNRDAIRTNAEQAARRRTGCPWALGIGLVVAVVGAAVAVLRVRQAEGALAQLRAEMVEVRSHAAAPPLVIRELRVEERVAVPAASSPPPVVDPGAGTPDERGLGEEERMHRLATLREARAAALDEAHRGEAVDPTWSASATESLRARLSDEDRGLLDVSTDCRSTICRVEFRYDTTGAGADAARRFTAHAPWAAQHIVAWNQQDGRGSWFIARAGAALPKADPQGATR